MAYTTSGGGSRAVPQRQISCVHDAVLQSPANPRLYSALFESFSQSLKMPSPPLLAYRIITYSGESISHGNNYCTSTSDGSGYTPVLRVPYRIRSTSLRKVVSKQIVSTSGNGTGFTFDCDNFFWERIYPLRTHAHYRGHLHSHLK